MGDLPLLNSARTQSPVPTAKERSQLGAGSFDRLHLADSFVSPLEWNAELTLSLLLVAVDGEGGPSVLTKPVGEVVCCSLGGDEDEDLALLLGDRLEVRLDEDGALLVLSVDDLDLLGDLLGVRRAVSRDDSQGAATTYGEVGGGVEVTDRDVAKFLEEAVGELTDLARPGSREPAKGGGLASTS